MSLNQIINSDFHQNKPLFTCSTMRRTMLSYWIKRLLLDRNSDKVSLERKHTCGCFQNEECMQGNKIANKAATDIKLSDIKGASIICMKLLFSPNTRIMTLYETFLFPCVPYATRQKSPLGLYIYVCIHRSKILDTSLRKISTIPLHNSDARQQPRWLKNHNYQITTRLIYM